MTLEVTISGLRLKNPIILGSGSLSASITALVSAEKKGFGAVVTKTATLLPNEGNPKPRWAFSPHWLVSADGLPNSGYLAMAMAIEEAKERGVAIPIIGSVAGSSPKEYAEMAGEMAAKGADAVELNMVCPHRGSLVGGPVDEPMGRYWSQTPERAYEVVRAVKDTIKIPVWAKFPSVPVLDHPEIAQSMEEAGADAVVTFPGAFPAMVIDLATGKPVLGNIRGTGTLTGRAVKPAGIKLVAEMARTLSIPIIGTGGVYTGLDVVEYIMVGAQAVGGVTAFMEKTSVGDLVSEMKGFLAQHGYSGLEDFRGKSLEYLRG